MVYRVDQPAHRTEYQKETGTARFYYLRPIGFGSAMLGRVYKRNTHPGDSEMRPLQNSLFKICSFHHIFVPL